MKIDKIPDWIDENTKLTSDLFKKLFIFSVINFPIPEKSARAIPLPEGVEVPLRNYKAVRNASEMEEKLIESDLISFPPPADYTERAVFTCSQDTVVLSFIDHIRNSIAHGRFNIMSNRKEYILILEDRNKNGECSGRIIAKLNTLVKWIDEIKNPR